MQDAQVTKSLTEGGTPCIMLSTPVIIYTFQPSQALQVILIYFTGREQNQ